MNTVIYDLDGTLSLMDHRKHYLKGKKNYKEFFKACVYDEPNMPVIMTMVDHAVSGRNIIIATGRTSTFRPETEVWLNEHVWPLLPQDFKITLHMRHPDDFRSGADMKRSWLQGGFLPKDDIICAYEDSPDVVAMWREENIACFQVRGD